MLKRTGATAAVLGAACLALAIAYVQVREQNRAAQAATQRELRELREAMSALRSQVGPTQLAGNLERAAPRRDAPAEEPAASDDDAPLALRDYASGDEPKSFGEAMQRSEETFRDEAIDAAWAGAATDELHGALGKLLPAGATVRGLSCHSTRCRLEVHLRDAASLDQFQRAALYGAEVLWRGQMMIDQQPQGDGTIAMVAHLIRAREL